MREKRIPHIGNDAGFTLLEIIAVMVIMSILAVVAVPKYFDLQNQARERAMDTAVAEAIGRVNSYFAQQLLSGATPSGIVYNTDNIGGTDPNVANGEYNMGDFHLEVAESGDNITLTITPHAPAFGTGYPDRVETITRPGLVSPSPTP